MIRVSFCIRKYRADRVGSILFQRTMKAVPRIGDKFVWDASESMDQRRLVTAIVEEVEWYDMAAEGYLKKKDWPYDVVVRGRLICEHCRG